MSLKEKKESEKRGRGIERNRTENQQTGTEQNIIILHDLFREKIKIQVLKLD